MNRNRFGIGCAAEQEKATAVLLRSGKISDKQVFIIICLAAIAVAAVTLGNFFLGKSGPAPVPTWQCIECNHKFFQSGERLPLPPIECPECHKIEAVMLSYRVCKKCRTRSVYSRTRLPAEYAAEYQRRAAQGQPPGGMETSYWPREIQFRLPGADEQWTDWVLSRSPEAKQIRVATKCPKCGESLYPKRGRKDSGGN